MPFNGSGIFNPLITFEPNTLATAEDQNSQDADIAGGLSDCMTRDGQGPATAPISMGGFQINNVGSGVASTDVVNVGQLTVLLPTGTVLPFAGSSAPSGYLLCFGQLISRATYSALFGVIGTTFGVGDGTTTYQLPDMRGNLPAGADNIGGTPANRLTGYVVGTSGGTQSQTISTTNLPAHNHAVTDPGHVHTITDPGHVHTQPGGFTFVISGSGSGVLNVGSAGVTDASTPSAVTGISVNSATTGVTTQNTGSGTALPVVQPTLALNYMIKI